MTQKSENTKNSKHKFSLYPKMLVKSKKLAKIGKMGKSSIIQKAIFSPKTQKSAFLGQKGPKIGQIWKKIKNSKHKFSLYSKMPVISRKLAKISKMDKSSIIFKEISNPQNPYIILEKLPKITKYVPTSTSHNSDTKQAFSIP